jgi:hypothetical protein
VNVLSLHAYQLRRDRRRSLARGQRALDAHGWVPDFGYQPAVPGSALAREIGRAYVARCLQAGRPWDVRWIGAMIGDADEAATLRVGDGELAAWALVTYGEGVAVPLPRARAAATAGCGLAATGLLGWQAAQAGAWPWALAGGLLMTCAVAFAFATVAAWQSPACKILAGQGVPGYEDLHASFMLDADVLRHAREEAGCGYVARPAEHAEASLLAGAS